MIKRFHANHKNSHTANLNEREKKVRYYHILLQQYNKASYSDKIAPPILVTTEESYYDEYNVKKVGCNRQPLVAKQIKYLSFYC